MHERFHCLEIVVHAGEQHALIAERNSGVRQTLERFFYFNREFTWMVHVHAHPKRVVFGENRTQFRRDPLGQENRYARADAEKFDVLDRAQPRRERGGRTGIAH